MWIDIVLTIGVINGLTLTIALFTIKNGNPLATKVFGLIVLLISLIILESLLIKLQFHLVFPYFLRSTDGFLLVMMPALYFYALLATETKTKIHKLDWLHLVPFLLFTVWLIPDYLAVSDKIQPQIDAQEIAILGYIKALSALLYFPLAVGHIFKFQKISTNNQLPAINLKNIKWFYYMLISLIIIAGISLFVFVLEVNEISIPGPDSDITAGILLTVAFQINGLVLIRNPYILWNSDKLKTLQSGENSGIKYRTSPLSSSQLQEYLDQLIFQMEHKQVYRNPDLELKQLEEITGIKSYYITEVINTLLGQNFYEFVNNYRIEEVKRKLMDPANDQKTVLSLAFESGFNSKSSFNRIFKIHSGKSPTHYRKESQKNF